MKATGCTSFNIKTVQYFQHHEVIVILAEALSQHTSGLSLSKNIFKDKLSQLDEICKIFVVYNLNKSQPIFCRAQNDLRDKIFIQNYQTIYSNGPV